MPSAAAIKKQGYAKRVNDLLDNYDTALLVHADNVGSKQFMDIRAVSTRCRGFRFKALKPSGGPSLAISLGPCTHEHLVRGFQREHR
jgi:hypothetical protein